MDNTDNGGTVDALDARVRADAQGASDPTAKIEGEMMRSAKRATAMVGGEIIDKTSKRPK